MIKSQMPNPNCQRPAASRQLLSLVLLLFAVACGSDPPANIAVPPTFAPTVVPTLVPTDTPMGPLTLLSAAFETEGEIPVRHAQKPFTAVTDSGDFICSG